MKDFGIKKLANGLRVITKPLPGHKAITIEVLVGVGSKYEKASEYGLSHFLEHMMFKGTTKRPAAELINKEVDAKGAVSNAGTGHELTSYYITTVAENREWAIELLSDVLINSTFDNEEVKKERGVIAEEIKMYQDNPMSGLSSDFMDFVWGGSPIGCWNISGKVKDVLRYERADVYDFWLKYYSPDRVVVVIAGDLEGDEADLVEKYFGDWMKSSVELPVVTIDWTSNKHKVLKRKSEQGHLVVGFPGLTKNDARRWAFKLLEVVLVGNSSSRLFQKIREERGWAYYVFSISDMFKETGLWGIQTGVIKHKLSEVGELVVDEMMEIGSTLTEEEIARAKDFVSGKTKLAMDRSDFWTTYLGEKELLGERVVDVDEELNKIRQVMLAEVKKLASELAKRDKLRVMKLI